MVTTPRIHPGVVAGALGTAALGLALVLLWPQLMALREPAAGYDMARMLLLHARLPRIATAILSGAALALAGAILQQVLRNPLASPTTLGVSAGANLALAVATLWFPLLLGFGRDLVALAGSALTMTVVLALVSRRGYSPFALVLAGLVASLYCGALAALLVLMNDRYLVSLFIWGGGSLAQQDWSVPVSLLARIAVLVVLAALLVRPLALLDLDEGGARALGVPVRAVRVSGIAVAVALAAFVTSAVGVIGFVGLVAPAIARLAGARSLRARLVWSPLIGGSLLWLTDEAVQALAGSIGQFVPTGAVTALLGSPLLLFLLPRLRSLAGSALDAGGVSARRRVRPSRLLAPLAGVLGLVVAGALVVGRAPDGSWAILAAEDWASVLPWRWPRVVAAGAAGVLLACAGAILQRLTANPMASPEILGISAGATLGVTLAIFLAPTLGSGGQIGAAFLAALVVLVAIFAFGRRSGFAPERVLLAGIALSAFVDAIAGALAATGDPRALQVLRWISGSTSGVDASSALMTAGLAGLLLSSTLLARRWLDLLVLGPAAAAGLGLRLATTRAALLVLAASCTATATLVVGPLSFVGLMAPHVTRELGLARGLPQVAGAALAGAGLMVVADWLGRVMDFPYQLPAGLISALVGAPLLMLLLRRGGD
ncbi:Fe(3+)-hydroxamate ABC transporter permease FhuB [Salinarimonas sp.]|uniref:Fe(3+)-hydroxamate ABC transporter permease FhuB n=1 Tax=Salinarimonas sp. TaxID=2766526 RepID=UPI0032D91793